MDTKDLSLPLTIEAQKFLVECPAWARKIGVQSLKVWQIIEFAMPLSSSDRFDYLDWQEEEGVLTVEEGLIARKVLRVWDDMAGKPL